MDRLSTATLGVARGVRASGYDRSSAPAIVHLGLGAFARAHLGVYADELWSAGWPAGIHGVSLHSPRAEQALAPQDGWYTVSVREPDVAEGPQLVGSVVAASTGPAAAVGAIADPSVQLVTLTITEKGYVPPAGAARDHTPTAPAVLARALAERRRRGAAPPVIASLDNLLANGRILADRVTAEAERIDAPLAEWVRREVAFPCSVVDRMVPATTDADRAAVAAHLGLLDEAAVVAEAHRSWAIEAVDGLPPLADVGVTVTSDIELFERRKLWLLNGPHSALAYTGLVAGHSTIAEAVADPDLATFIRAYVDDALEVADLRTADGAAFAVDALRRFANPALGHTCAQVGADGSSKLAQRLLPVVAAREARGLPTGRFATVAACWIAAAGGITIGGTAAGGRRLARVDDPAAPAIVSALRRGVVAAAVAAGLPTASTAFAQDVRRAIERLRCDGWRMLRDEQHHLR